ncbi:23S rRNA (adenine(2503)-C(2))-methyltransferase RlmN [Sporolituus thermophilus]|uniref:Probable dual-specificity RNA methyltransferase RlmN n=1 Tax=Sporolituus thermophilus DSM 23256 TaxID=1123285 RepID=A0A1G7KT25_9FIRM|nr:23S rRNA (adenine(2503)-C(2))-methyltransferase RlmN [Sporolituus thermophilus]SDF40301.1 23S rRNA m(2)A-2503 methyltransferase [Sporolituus thermophilus DSM 23256]
MKTNIFGYFAQEISDLIAQYGLEKYRGRQIAEWIYRRGVSCFADMTNLPLKKRDLLAENFTIDTAYVTAAQHSADRKTSKFLLKFSDGAAVETVLMRHSYGNSLCVSTQVGCGMGCSFCASTLQGVARNLSGGEILAQAIFVNNLLSNEQSRLNSIVIMGSGEPLANYDNVLRFIRLCHEPYCLNLSYRNITLSTCGLVPEMRKLAAEGLPITLAVSLHAPNNELRSQIMPINRRYPIEEVIAAADYYATTTGRRVTYEYTLIKGVNDGLKQAYELARLLAGRLANVNLIAVNAVPERGLLRPDEKQIAAFEQALLRQNVNATVRREMGADIQAACGQLRKKVLAQQEAR